MAPDNCELRRPGPAKGRPSSERLRAWDGTKGFESVAGGRGHLAKDTSDNSAPLRPAPARLSPPGGPLEAQATRSRQPARRWVGPVEPGPEDAGPARP